MNRAARPAGWRTARFLNTMASLPGAGRSSRFHAWVFRASGGRIMRRWFGGPVMALEVVGRKSGRTYRVPLVYLEVDDGFVVMAANGGRGPIPEWYRNLLAAGTGVADLGRRRLRVTPRVLDGDEREAMAATLAHVAPSTPHYSTLAGRELPLVLLALDGPA